MSPSRKVKVGDRYRLAVPYLGQGPGMLVSGQEVTVADLVSADTPGAHSNDEDAVVVEFEEPTFVADTDSEPSIRRFVDQDGVERSEAMWPIIRGSAPRRVAVGAGVFDEQFEAVK